MIESRGTCTQPQRAWLRRISERLLQELVVDRDALDQKTFRSEGGFTRLNKVFDGKLESLLADINEETWRRVGRSVGPANPLGTYNNPIQDELEGDLSVPVHRGMYCAAGAWHHGWLRPWERSPVIKPSCGSAVYQMPH
jgi:hypothetical protein